MYLMVIHDIIRFPKGLPFFRGSGMESVEDGRFLVCWGIELGQGLPSSRGPFSFSRVLAGAVGAGGTYSW